MMSFVVVASLLLVHYMCGCYKHSYTREFEPVAVKQRLVVNTKTRILYGDIFNPPTLLLGTYLFVLYEVCLFFGKTIVPTSPYNSK